MYNEDILPPYYVDGPNSAHVDMVSAVSLLCKYCATLSTDIYSISQPIFYIKTLPSKKRIVYIELPTACPILQPIMVQFYCLTNN